MEQKNTRQLKKDLLFLTGLLFGFFFLLWKSKYGTGAYDEPFYLTMPHRILKGDGMFSQEWNFGQFSAFLMLPVMKIYLLIRGTTEGIILGFRYLYIFFQVTCTILIYVNLRKKEFSWIAAWMFCLFCPYDIMALSYNTMGMAFMTMTGVILSRTSKNNTRSFVAAGILFAAAVLCNPFLAAIYFFYTILVFGMWWKQKRSGKEPDKVEKGNLSLKAWGGITAGVLLLAAAFVITVLSGSTIQELIKNIPLLMQDPEHTSRSVFEITRVYLLSFWNVYGWFVPVWMVLLFMAYLCRADELKRKICFALVSFSSILSLFGFLETIQNSYNFIMVPILACGVAAYIMTEEKDKDVFRYLFVFGILYSFLANYASNQGMHAISMAMLPADVAAVLFIGKFASQEMESLHGEMGRKGKRMPVLFILLFTVQLGMQIYTKAVHAFWEEPVWKLQTVIEEGPLKGTVTTERKAERYASVLEDIKTHIRKEGPVLFVTEDTWCYLYADTEYGTFSSYLSGGFLQAAERWKLYYNAHPEKIPDYICFPVAEISFDWGPEVLEAAEEYGYEVEVSKEAYHLYKK